VLVDSFVKWRIVDVKQYYISVAGRDAGADAFDANGECGPARRIRANALSMKWCPASAMN